MNTKFFIDDPEITKFGYFSINDFKSFSKFEAYQYAKNNLLPVDNIIYNFNNDVYDKIDWTIDILTDINELYYKRAKQLREKYDYIVIMFSGGIDGYTALHSFLDNNLAVDEVVTCANTKYLDKPSKFNQEVYNLAIPHINELQKTYNFKFNLVEVGDMILNQYLDDYQLKNFIYNANGTLATWTIAIRSHMFKLLQQHHVSMAKSGKKIGYIWGLEKPTIHNYNGKYSFKFVDASPDFATKNYISKYIYTDLKNFTDEAFFVSREIPELSIKQAQLLSDYLNSVSNTEKSKLVNYKQLANTGPFVFHSVNKELKHFNWLKKTEVEKVIYPNIKHSMFGDDKVKGSLLYTSRDSWFFRTKSFGRNLYVQKIKKILRENEGYFKFTEDGTPINSILITSKPYPIKDIKHDS